MFIELLKDHGSHKAGTVIEEGSETIARAFISEGIAKESNAMAHMLAAIKSREDEKDNAVLAELRTLNEAMRGYQSKPPGGSAEQGEARAKVAEKASDPGVPISSNRVDISEASFERGARCFTDVLRCVAWHGGINTPPALRELADKRLRRHYGFDEIEYTIDENSGRLFEIRRDGSTGEVYRTGTESMGGGPSYGFLVKPEYYPTLFRIMQEDSIIADNAMNIPLGNGVEMKWPALDQFGTPVAGQSSSYAGIQLYRATETQQRTASDFKTNMIDFKVTDLTGFSSLSRDLLADSFIAADTQLQTLFGMAFAWRTDWEYLNGSGIGMPTGIANSKATIAVSRDTTSKILFEDISKMQATLHPSLWKYAYWVTNVTCIPQLQNIKDHAGNAVYQPNALIGQGMTPSIMGARPEGGGERGVTTNGNLYRFQGWLNGLPVRFSEKVPVLGSRGDLMLIAPAMSYGIATKGGLEVGLSEHFYFDTDRIAFRFKLRNDAKPLWRAPYQQADGSNTQVSPFVVLAA